MTKSAKFEVVDRLILFSMKEARNDTVFCLEVVGQFEFWSELSRRDLS